MAGQALEPLVVEETELEGRLRSGASNAAGELFRMYWPAIRDLCRRRIADPHLADDLAQETFLRAMGSIDSFKEGYAVWPWLSTIARNLCIDAVRSWNRRPSSVHLDAGAAQEELASRSERADQLAQHDPAEHATEGDRLARLQIAIATGLTSLTSLERRAVWYHHAEEEAYESIAARERTTIDTVRNAAFRARKHLRVSLAESVQDLRALGPGVALGLRLRWSAMRARLRTSMVAARMTATPIVDSFMAGLGLVAGVIALTLLQSSVVAEAAIHHDVAKPARVSTARTEPTESGTSRRTADGRSAIVEPVRDSLTIERREDAVLPAEATLSVEIVGPDGSPLFWMGTSVKCGDGRAWKRLPDKGVVRATC